MNDEKFLLKKDNTIFPTTITLSYDDKPCIIYPIFYKDLNQIKNKIDENNIEWDKMKKVSNPYELIYTSHQKDKYNNIAKYNPLSRSYFKMWEMIYEFDILKKNYESIIVACLAEGPG